MSIRCSQPLCPFTATRQSYASDYDAAEPFRAANFVPWCAGHAPRHAWPLVESEPAAATRAAVPVVTDGGYGLGYADEGVRGYTPTTYTYESYDEAKAAARMWNERAGLSPQRAADIVLSTMGG